MNIYDQAPIIYKNVLGTPYGGLGGPVMGADWDVAQFEATVASTIGFTDLTGTFEVGETITGGTSGAIATVVAINADSLTISLVSGTFVTAETITGGTSGATATTTTLDIATYKFVVIGSNQVNPPDLSMPSSPTNKYEEIAYNDVSDNVNYVAGSEFSPDGISGTYKFNISSASRWYFITLADVIDGTSVPNVDVTLSN